MNATLFSCRFFADVVNMKFSELNPLACKMGPEFNDCIYKRKERAFHNTQTHRGEGQMMMEAEIK